MNRPDLGVSRRGFVAGSASLVTGCLAALGLRTTDRRKSGAGVDPAREVAALHDAGVTGSHVRVGVVDATGFDVDGATRESVIEVRSFGAEDRAVTQARENHGWYAAETIARVAPDASTYLASIGDASAFVDAVTWHLSKEVDVLAAPVSFYGEPVAVEAIVGEAVTDGVAVVVPAGNLGAGQWRGQFVPTATGAHQFGDDTLASLEGSAEIATLWLTWEGARADDEFALTLFRRGPVGWDLVARSTPYEGGRGRTHRLVADVAPGGSYAVSIRGPPTATGTPLRLRSPTHDLSVADRANSIVPPATAPEALAVGAVDPATGRVAAYSSAGSPAGDGPGVDLVGPGALVLDERPFVGTSAAASFVAGVLALLRDAAPSLEPTALEAALETTAADVPGSDATWAAGAGRVDSTAALERVRRVGDRRRRVAQIRI